MPAKFPTPEKVYQIVATTKRSKIRGRQKKKVRDLQKNEKMKTVKTIKTKGILLKSCDKASHWALLGPPSNDEVGLTFSAGSSLVGPPTYRCAVDRSMSCDYVTDWTPRNDCNDFSHLEFLDDGG